MATVTCPQCGAYFEVDFEPGTEFTCGNCQSSVEVPQRPVVRPKSMPQGAKARSTGPAPSSADLPKNKKPISAKGKGGSHHRPAKAGPSKGLILAAVAGLIGLAIVLVLVLSTEDPKKSTDKGSANGSGSNTTKTSDKDPYEAAKDEALKSKTIPALLRFGNLAHARWLEAGGGTKGEAKRPLQDLRWAFKQVIAVEPDHIEARDRLNEILFDKLDVEKLLVNEGLPEALRSQIRDFSIEIEEEHKAASKHIWLQKDKDHGKRWAALSARAQEESSLASARETDPFYKTAEREGQRVANELNDSTTSDFHREGITGEAFEVHAHKPYVFVVQRDQAGREEQIASRWSRVLRDLQTTFYGAYQEGTGLDPMIRPTIVLILRDADEYAKYIRLQDKFAPVVSGGHYSPGTGQLICYMQTEDLENTVLFHEGTHQLVDWGMRAAGVGPKARQSLWFSEGLADYFGGHARAMDGKSFIPGRLSEKNIELIAEAKGRSDLFKLDALLNYSRTNYNADRENPFASRKVSIAYAQGWALCYFLQKWLDGKYAGKFVRYVGLEFKGRSGMGAFTEVFGSELGTMESEFLAMIDELESARVAKKIINGEIRK